MSAIETIETGLDCPMCGWALMAETDAPQGDDHGEGRQVHDGDPLRCVRTGQIVGIAGVDGGRAYLIDNEDPLDCEGMP